MRGGELGSIPALIGLVVISAVFSFVHQGFLSAYNIEALVIQAAPVILMAMGLVFVLLLGEIDLSAGTTGGLCSASWQCSWYGRECRGGPRLSPGWWPVSSIGFGIGWLRAQVGIPSFVITLATFLAFQGVTLILVGGQGSLNLPDEAPHC